MAWRHTAEATKKAERTIKGHRGHVVYGAKYSCECGWQSGTWYGKGAQSNAAAEFFYHKLDHVAAEHEGMVGCASGE